MPFTTPTLPEITARIKSDVQSRLGTQPLLPNSVLSILSVALAGAIYLLYGFLSWAFRQCFTDTSEAEFLDADGSEVGVVRLEASFASGNVTFTGTNGSTVPSGTSLQRSDGVLFTTQAIGTISGGTATVEVQADDAGSAGNTAEGIILTLTSPVVGVSASAAVASGGIDGGTERETDEAYRARILARKRNPPQGGSESDYEAWALSVSGVTRAWVTSDLGTVNVAIVADEAVDGPIPSPTLVAETQAYIDTVRPVTAELTVYAPTALEVDFEIQLSPNNATVQAAVTAELKDLFRRTGEPGGTILISKIREAVSIATGEGDNVVVSPSANVVADPGELPVVKTPITFAVIP